MKKHLLVAAVAAAVAVPAMAQTVTMDGVIDQMYGRVDPGGNTSTTGSYTGPVRNTFSTTQYNIRGVEDLGGGMKAGFRLSQQFSATTGATTANWDGDGFNETSVFISGDFGKISVGQQDLAAREGFGYGRFNNFGRSASSVMSVGDERNAAVNYDSPSINGFHFAIGYASPDRSGVSSSTVNQGYGKSQGYGIGYSAGPLKVGVGLNTGDYTTNGTTKTDAKDTAFGAQYDFGAVRLAAAYLTQDNDKSSGGKKSNTLVSAVVPLSNGLSVMAAALRYKDTNVASDNTAKGYQLALTKDLSKRTMVYAAYATLDQDAGVSYGMRGNIGGATSGADPEVFGLGVRHSF